MFVEKTEEQMQEVPVLRQISPVALAFVGDTVFDLFLRTRIVLAEKTSPKQMHLHASQYGQGQHAGQDGQSVVEYIGRRRAGCIATGAECKSTYDTQTCGSGRL